MDDRLTVTFDPALSSMITLRASQENESNLSGFVARLLRAALGKNVQPKANTTTVSSDISISPELQAFVGIAKTKDNREWKERKTEYLTEKHNL